VLSRLLSLEKRGKMRHTPVEGDYVFGICGFSNVLADVRHFGSPNTECSSSLPLSLLDDLVRM